MSQTMITRRRNMASKESSISTDGPKNILWGPLYDKTQARRLIREQEAEQRHKAINPSKKFDNP